MKILIISIVIFNLIYQNVAGLKKSAALTHYWSYPPCCKGNENYDPSADRTECDHYNGCTWAGYFKAVSGKKSLSWVKSNDIVSFFDASDKDGKNFMKNYGGKKIRLTKNNKTFTATIYDTCSDKDCNGCCSANARNGYLVDLEYYTAVRHLGSASKAYGTIQFEIL